MTEFELYFGSIIDGRITACDKMKRIADILLNQYASPQEFHFDYEIAKKHNLFVLEDACQGNGGFFKGKRLGSIGDAGAFSFNYFKIISAGEGGALLTNNQEIFEKALIFDEICDIIPIHKKNKRSSLNFFHCRVYCLTVLFGDKETAV